MMITGITAYTPIRQPQKISFGYVLINSYVKFLCDLTDKDITELDNRCPKDLVIKVETKSFPDGWHRNCCAQIYYKGHLKKDERQFKAYSATHDSVTSKRTSKKNFMECINQIINDYSGNK